METFVTFMNVILEFMKRPMDIYGYMISLWDIFMFTCISSMVCRFVARLFN